MKNVPPLSWSRWVLRPYFPFYVPNLTAPPGRPRALWRTGFQPQNLPGSRENSQAAEMIQGAQTYEGLDVGGWEVEGGKVSRVKRGRAGEGRVLWEALQEKHLRTSPSLSTHAHTHTLTGFQWLVGKGASVPLHPVFKTMQNQLFILLLLCQGF